MYSIVIPTLNSEKSLHELCSRIITSINNSHHFEIIFVDDHSSDGTWDLITKLTSKHEFIRGIKLSRNYGQHNALLCGIRNAKGSFIITMDDDLQHPPEVVPELIEKLDEGFDAVYGYSESQKHSLSRIASSRITKFAIQKTVGVSFAPYISALRIFKTDLRDAFQNYNSNQVNIDVLLSWATLNFGTIKVEHSMRKFGGSGYSTTMLIKHTLNMMTGFTTRPLKFASMLGFAFSIFGLLTFGFVLIRWYLDGSLVPGFPFLASIISIFSGAQLICLGIIGEYLGRIYEKNSNKPTYNISKQLN